MTEKSLTVVWNVISKMIITVHKDFGGNKAKKSNCYFNTMLDLTFPAMDTQVIQLHDVVQYQNANLGGKLEPEGGYPFPPPPSCMTPDHY